MRSKQSGTWGPTCSTNPNVFPTIANMVCVLTGMMSAMCQGTSVSRFMRSQIFQCCVTLQSASQVSQKIDRCQRCGFTCSMTFLQFNTTGRQEQAEQSPYACYTSRLVCVLPPLHLLHSENQSGKSKRNFFFSCSLKFHIYGPAVWMLRPTLSLGCLTGW